VCGVAGWFGRIVVVAGAVVVLGASGCTTDGKGPVDPPAPSSSAASVTPTSSPSGTVEEQILAQYRRFWTETLPALFAARVEDRTALLRPVVTDPLLPALLRTAGDLDRKGQQATGFPILITQSVSRRGSEAIVVGCMDSSKASVKDRATGQEITRGRPRDPTEAFFKVGNDGVWRVYSLNERKGSRC
jgi:hypothetical protein